MVPPLRLADTILSLAVLFKANFKVEFAVSKDGDSYFRGISACFLG
jgi:hypothetical protein